MNILCTRIKPFVPVVHDPKAEILSSSYLVGYRFCFQIVIKTTVTQKNNLYWCFECPFNLWCRCFFGEIWKNIYWLYTAISRYFPQFTFCAKLAWYSFYVAFYYFFLLLFCFLGISFFDVLCSLFLVPEPPYQLFFIMSDANVKYLVYWLFFIEYWLARPFAKLEYFDWSGLAINRYAIHLLTFLDLILLFPSASVAFLNSLRFST